MTAFSLGRDAATPTHTVPAWDTVPTSSTAPAERSLRSIERPTVLISEDRGPVAKALGIITELIPAEAIAAYLAVVAAVAALPLPTGMPDYRQHVNLWLGIPVGVLVSLAFAFIGAASAIKATPADLRARRVRRVFFFGLLLGALFVVYVVAMPGNPIEIIWQIPSAYGGLAAVLITIGWGVGAALRKSLSGP